MERNTNLRLRTWSIIFAISEIKVSRRAVDSEQNYLIRHIVFSGVSCRVLFFVEMANLQSELIKKKEKLLFYAESFREKDPVGQKDQQGTVFNS